jgi:hypothetical protein
MPDNNPRVGETWVANQIETIRIIRVDGRRLDSLVHFQSNGALASLPLATFVSRYSYDVSTTQIQSRERPVGREATRVALDHLRERIDNPHNLLQLDQADPYTRSVMQELERQINEEFGPPGLERNTRIRDAVQRRTGQQILVGTTHPLTAERNAAMLRDAPPLSDEERRIVDALVGSIREVLEQNDSLRGNPIRLELVRAEIAQRLLVRGQGNHNVVPQWVEDDTRAEMRAREDKLFLDTLKKVGKPEPPKPTQWERLSREDDDA